MTKVISQPRTSIHSTLPSNSFARGPTRLPAESAEAYRAFRIYLNLGPGRSLDRAWQFSRAGSGGKDHASARRPGLWSGWSVRYQWVDRAAAYDKFSEERRRGAEADWRRSRPEDNADRELVNGEQRGPSVHRDQASDTGQGDLQDNHGKTRNIGRRSKITDQLVEDFCNFVGMTGSIEYAIKATGIGRETYYRWARTVHDGGGSQIQKSLIRRVEAALANPKLRCEQLLSKHCQNHWRAITWWLSRKYPNEYGRRRPLPLSDWDARASPPRRGALFG
jgi:hypothetical protein